MQHGEQARRRRPRRATIERDGSLPDLAGQRERAVVAGQIDDGRGGSGLVEVVAALDRWVLSRTGSAAFQTGPGLF